MYRVAVPAAWPRAGAPCCQATLAGLLTCALALGAGCSSDANSNASRSNDCTNNGAVVGSTGSLPSFQSPPDPGAGGFLFTASGEALALGGYGFPGQGGGITFVDGWEMHFERLLVTFDNVTLAQNPDFNPGEQSQTGSAVAQVNGPWAVDLHRGGPLQGKGGSDEQAVPIASLTGQNLNGCSGFDPTQRYALSYDVVPATANALNVNLDADAELDYAEMISQKYTALFVGTAMWKAGSAGVTCVPSDPEFDQLPKVVHFRLGFRTPTSYLNCQNPDNDPAEPLSINEEHLRGVLPITNRSVSVQLTVHTDHPFWDSPVHDAPLHFDQIAARYVGLSDTPTARTEDFAGIDYTHFTDSAGNPVRWRNCLGSLYTPPDSGTMHFYSAGHVFVDYATFMTYNEGTSGHLNSDGLCAVQRNYPSPL